MFALALWLNIPLMLLAFGLTTGVPLWLVLRRPGRNPAETRSVPAYAAHRTQARPGVPVGARGLRPVRVMVPSAQH